MLRLQLKIHRRVTSLEVDRRIAVAVPENSQQSNNTGNEQQESNNAGNATSTGVPENATSPSPP